MPDVSSRVTIEELQGEGKLLIDVEVYGFGKMIHDGPPEGLYLDELEWEIESATATDDYGNEVAVTISKDRQQVERDGKPVLTSESVERINNDVSFALCEADF